MRIVVFILLLVVQAHAAVSESNIQENLQGSWHFIHDISGCEEVYTFTEKGALLTMSGGSLSIDAYTVSKSANEKNRIKITASNISVHGFADCSGDDSFYELNNQYSFFVEFHPDFPNEMIVYYDATEPNGFGPLKRILISNH